MTRQILIAALAGLIAFVGGCYFGRAQVRRAFETELRQLMPTR